MANVSNYFPKIPKHKIKERLRKSGIECRDMVPLTNQPCYKFSNLENAFPVASYQ